MHDLLFKGHLKGAELAFACVAAAGAADEAVRLHDCDPAAAHLLGRALAGALLSAALLPEGQRINLCWKYQGMLRSLVVDAGQDGTVRGFIAPPRLQEAGGTAELYRDLGDLQAVVSDAAGKIISSGTAPVPFQDVVRDLAYYHCLSHQVETGMAALIGFQADPEHPVRLCNGLMIQALPGADLEQFDRIRARMHGAEFRRMLAQELQTAAQVEALVRELAGGEPGGGALYSAPAPAPRFFCPCNREKMNAVVRTLPIPERMDIVRKNESLGVNCQFCARSYMLTVEECIAAWNRAETGRQS